jgi:hypothetical protein
MAVRAYWKGSLKLSLVSCPVLLYPASTPGSNPCISDSIFKQPATIQVESRHCERSNPFFLFAARWIASRSLSSGAHSRDPLARNDG